MTQKRAARRLTIPVKYVEERWEYFHGGPVPVQPDTIADLVVSSGSISDPAFLQRMNGRKLHKVLDQGTSLLVSLIIKDGRKIPANTARHLIPHETIKHQLALDAIEKWSSELPHFVEVRLAPPTARQARSLKTRTGGLWLGTQGDKAIGLFSTDVSLPEGVSDRPAGSLNHAFTKLSEVFETWRISHTGNAYTRILYQEKNGNWYPLDTLRNATLRKEEQEIAQALWRDFLSKVSSNHPASDRK